MSSPCAPRVDTSGDAGKRLPLALPDAPFEALRRYGNEDLPLSRRHRRRTCVCCSCFSNLLSKGRYAIIPFSSSSSKSTSSKPWREVLLALLGVPRYISSPCCDEERGHSNRLQAAAPFAVKPYTSTSPRQTLPIRLRGSETVRIPSPTPQARQPTAKAD